MARLARKHPPATKTISSANLRRTTRRSWRWLGLLFLAGWLGSVAQSQEAPADRPVGEVAKEAADVEPAPEKADQTKYQRGVVIEFDGEITQWLEGYFLRKLAKAQAAGCDLIVLRVESPGGLLIESQSMANKLRDALGVQTVAYIPNYAYSGGAYVSLGADEIVMGPSASLGDVGVIFQDLDAFKYVPEKIMSPVVSEIRALAETHGRPPALAEAMVDKDCEVFRVRQKSTGKITYMSEKELAAQENRDDWEQLELVLESQQGKFLTVSGKRAVALGLASRTANNLEEVKQRYQVQDEWLYYRPDNIDRTVYVLTLWWVTGLLFLVGIIGMFYELSAPGTCVGGLFALTCFSLFFWSRFLVGTSGLLELCLFMLALIFLGAEIFVIPGFGIAGVMGVLLLGISLVLACQTFIIPETQAQWSRLGTSLALVGGTGIAVIVIGAAMVQFYGTIPFFNRLVLAPPSEKETSPAERDVEKNDKTEFLARVGEIGRTEFSLRPTGRARFGDRFLDVVADDQFIDKGALVEVIAVDEQMILVREVKTG